MFVYYILKQSFKGLDVIYRIRDGVIVLIIVTYKSAYSNKINVKKTDWVMKSYVHVISHYVPQEHFLTLLQLKKPTHKIKKDTNITAHILGRYEIIVSFNTILILKSALLPTLMYCNVLNEYLCVYY